MTLLDVDGPKIFIHKAINCGLGRLLMSLMVSIESPEESTNHGQTLNSAIAEPEDPRKNHIREDGKKEAKIDYTSASQACNN